ncbi:phospholipase-like protein [Tanacetum coccineum]
MARCNDLYAVKIVVRSSVKLLKEIKDILKRNPTCQMLFRRTVFGPCVICSEGLSDMDAVRFCLLLVAELVFMGKEDRNCIPRHLVSLVEDFDCWNDYPWGEYMWVFILFRANDNKSSCLSPEMPNDEVVVAGTAIHNADEMYDSPNCVTDNDVNERIGVSSNYSMSTCSGADKHLAEVVVASMEIDKGDGHIDISTASDNDVNLSKTSFCLMTSWFDFKMKLRRMLYTKEMLFLLKKSGSSIEAIIIASDRIDIPQHDDHVDCSVAKLNDHPTADIGVNPVHVKKERKKSDMKTNYVLRSAKERKKRLAMALESPFWSNNHLLLQSNLNVHLGVSTAISFCPLILKRPQNCKKDKISLPDGLAEYLQMNDLLNYRFPWGYRDVVERLYSRSWRDVEKVYFSVNEPNRHWCLAELHITTGVVNFYDSLGWVYSNRRLWWRMLGINLHKT